MTTFLERSLIATKAMRASTLLPALKPTWQQMMYGCVAILCSLMIWRFALKRVLQLPVTSMTQSSIALLRSASMASLRTPIMCAFHRIPVCQAAYRHVALWRATVLDCEIVARPLRSRVRTSGFDDTDTLRLLVGDSSGARTLLTVAFEPWCANSPT